MPLTPQHPIAPSLTSPPAAFRRVQAMRGSTRTAWRFSPFIWGTGSILLLSMMSAGASGQQHTTEVAAYSSSLPDSPMPQFSVQSLTGHSSSEQGYATVSGVVLDSTGAAIPGAQISLSDANGTQSRSVTSGAGGEFAIKGLPAGSYLIIVSAKGFALFRSPAFELTAEEAYEVSNLILTVGSTDTEVTVRPTDVVAAEQIKAEEKQRFSGSSLTSTLVTFTTLRP